MANLTTLDKQILEKLFQMGGGYVLNFSDRTMGEFFREEILRNAELVSVFLYILADCRTLL